MGCILLNLSKPPFNNLKLRQATAYAVSSAQYVQVITKGVNATSNGPFVSNSPYFVADNNYPQAQRGQGQVAGQVRWHRRRGSRCPSPSTTPPTPTPRGSPSTSNSSSRPSGMKVTLAPVQQADIINTALLGSFEAQVWRQFGAVDPDLNYIFWSPTNANTPLFSINMARNTDPNMQAALLKGRESPAQSDRIAAYQEVSKLMGQDIPYVWTDRSTWSVGRPGQGGELRQPVHPAGGKAFPLIGGSIWPTQIWLNS